MLDLGDPAALVVTAALILLAFVPLASPRRAEPTRPFDLTLRFSAADELLSASFALPPQDPDAANRPLFPYSVIPGGVQSAGELKNAIAHDPVVAQHYAQFNLSKARRIKVTQDRLVYVSYRIGDGVFWTTRQLRIPRGETLISDGVHLARTRCGNRLSEAPMSPVSPKEPPRESLEQPPAPEVTNVETPPLEFVFVPPPPPITPVPPERGPFFIPPIFPIWWGSGPTPLPKMPSKPTHIPPSVPPAPVQTPEPGTWLLLLAGLLAVLLLRRLT